MGVVRFGEEQLLPSGKSRIKALAQLDKEELRKSVTLVQSMVESLDDRAFSAKLAFLASKMNRCKQNKALEPAFQGLALQAPRKAYDPFQAEPSSSVGSSPGPDPSPRTLRRTPAGATPWKGYFATAAADHSNEAISSMAYCPVLEGLVSDSCNKGWLISICPKFLNLWECNSDSLELKHSQAIDAVVGNMDIDTNAKLLLFSGLSPGNSRSIFLRSLTAANLFHSREAIRLEESAADAAHGLLRVCSLHTFGGPLTSAFAVAVGGNLRIYSLDSASASGTPAAPKVFWKAHEQPISTMHRSVHSTSFFTGSCDGTIKMWDMRSKPTGPAREFAHTKRVTGLTMLDPNTVCSSATDCSIQFWDTRSGDKTLYGFVPDSKPVLNLSSAGCLPNSISFTTTAGLYCYEFSKEPVLSPLWPLPPTGPCSQLEWNSRSMQIYAACPGGTINIFRKCSVG